MTTHRAPHLTRAQADRAAGVLLATACGDALGAGYEFGPPLADDVTVGMVGGGPFGWAPGEWTDDTSMAIAIAEVAATGADLRTAARPGRDRPALGRMGPSGTRHREADPGRTVLSRPPPHRRCPVRSLRRIPQAHGSFGRQRIPDAHRARRPGLPARPGRACRGCPGCLEPHPLRPASRRRLRAVVPGDSPRGSARNLRRASPRHSIGFLPTGPRDGRSCSTRPKPSRRRTSTTTGGWSKPCRAPGQPSCTPPSPTTTPRTACSPPSTCNSPSRPQSAAATTPTPSPRSPVGCWAPAGEPPRSP